MTSRTAPHVLVVEDDPLTRRMLGVLLASAGITSTTAADGLEATSYAATDRFDLVITDFSMPERNGVELIRTLRHRLGGVPVLMISAYPESEIRKEGLDDAGVEFVAKPFRTADLLAKVRAALAGAASGADAPEGPPAGTVR